MSSKPIQKKFKLQLAGGSAPGAAAPILGQAGVNVPQFSQQFNELTKDKQGEVVPVEVTVYADKSFSIVIKLPPMAELIKKALGLEKGSPDPFRDKKGLLSRTQIEEIAKIKMPELNAYDLEAACKIVAGQARSMGIEVEEI